VGGFAALLQDFDVTLTPILSREPVWFGELEALHSPVAFMVWKSLPFLNHLVDRRPAP